MYVVFRTCFQLRRKSTTRVMHHRLQGISTKTTRTIFKASSGAVRQRVEADLSSLPSRMACGFAWQARTDLSTHGEDKCGATSRSNHGWILLSRITQAMEVLQAGGLPRSRHLHDTAHSKEPRGMTCSATTAAAHWSHLHLRASIQSSSKSSKTLPWAKATATGQELSPVSSSTEVTGHCPNHNLQSNLQSREIGARCSHPPLQASSQLCNLLEVLAHRAHQQDLRRWSWRKGQDGTRLASIK